MRKIQTLLLSFLICLSSSAQTIVNRDWVSLSGEPNNTFSSQTSHLDASGNLIVVGNTVHASQAENMLITKYDPIGNQLWQQEFNGALNNTDFAIDVTTVGDNIYVTGVQADTPYGNNATLITTLALNPSGNILSAVSYPVSGGYHGHNVPARIIADGSGYIYVTGAIQVSPTEYDLVAIQYDLNLIQQWDYRAGQANTYTSGVSIGLTDQVVIYGVSGFNNANGDLLTIYLDPATGSQIAFYNVSTPNSYISQPVDLGVDAVHNIYEVGNVGSANNSDIIAMKLDTNLNVIWIDTIDGGAGQNDGARAMKVDPMGYSYITGYTTDVYGSRQAWTIALDPTGNKLWDMKYNNAEANAITIDASSHIYIAGKSKGENLTLAYDHNGNILWQKSYRATSTSTGEGRNIATDASGNVYVYGYSTTGSSGTYSTIKYEPYTKTNLLTTSIAGSTPYIANQLIIHFDRSAINQAAVNNLDINIADPGYFLTPSAYTALQSSVTFSLSDCKLERIYKGLKTTYRYSQARNGDMVPMPDFWASYVLIHPTPADGDETTVANGINTLFPLVTHTGLNYVAHTMGGCNPNPTYNISDLDFSYQHNLTADSCSNGPYNTYYGINMDSAWRLETGKPFIKVGVYDTYLYGQNWDFDPVTQGVSGDKAHGWDFYSGTSMDANNWQPAQNYHGTSVAGIIGAIRNNGHLIAGIAGGSFADTTDVGVTMYCMKIFDNTLPDPDISMPISDVANAVVYGTAYVPDSGYGYGLHVINNSWRLGRYLCTCHMLTIPEISELEQAFRSAYRNQATVVASAGNTRDYGYPANFYNDWILCVGGLDEAGQHWIYRHSPVGYDESFVGPSVDVCAPSISNTNYPAWTLSNGTSPNSTFSGTSMAAPHVTGTVALLMSYIDSTAPAYRNLSPEDAEWLVTRSAVDIDTAGKDDRTGWGQLNAGRTLREVNKMCKEIRHYDYRSDTVPVSYGGYYPSVRFTRIQLTEKYTNPDGITFDTIPYDCVVGIARDTIHHSIPSHYTIENSWARPSSTTFLLLYDSTTGTLQPYEHLYIDHIDRGYAALSGIFYDVYTAGSHQYLGKWGMSDTSTAARGLGFAYTILLRDNNKQCDSVTTGIRDIESHLNVSFYPNPVEDRGDLSIFVDSRERATISLMDMEGRTIRDIYSGSLDPGRSHYEINIKSLSPGVYFISLCIGETKETIKISKI